MRQTRAEVSLDAIRHNVGELRRLAAPAELLAVVKADAYGHGVTDVARAAVEAGASWLGVATVAEAAELREAGRSEPMLLLSEPHPSSMKGAVEADLVVTVYTAGTIEALARAAAAAARGVTVHLKVDTGMHRVGAGPTEAVALARAVSSHPSLTLGGVWTHCAVADEPDNPCTDAQLDLFEEVLSALGSAGLRPPLAHAANSAAAIAFPRSRFDMVRCGIALYGLAPSDALRDRAELRPALSLLSEVSFVKEVPAGTAVSYGLTYRTPEPGRLATVPVGYADGVPRRLSAVGGEVLIGGRRHPIAGVVTMDQLVVDCGSSPVEAGDEVVLIGRQGSEEITADEWADRLGTINYEIVCGLGPRVPRIHT